MSSRSNCNIIGWRRASSPLSPGQVMQGNLLKGDLSEKHVHWLHGDSSDSFDSSDPNDVYQLPLARPWSVLQCSVLECSGDCCWQRSLFVYCIVGSSVNYTSLTLNGGRSYPWPHPWPHPWPFQCNGSWPIDHQTWSWLPFRRFYISIPYRILYGFSISMERVESMTLLCFFFFVSFLGLCFLTLCGLWSLGFDLFPRIIGNNQLNHVCIVCIVNFMLCHHISSLFPTGLCTPTYNYFLACLVQKKKFITHTWN